MNTRTRNLVLSVTLSISVLGAGTLAYGSIAPSSGSSSQSTTRLVSASLGSVESTVNATGTLAPATSLDLNFVNAGTLTSVSVKAGDTVTAGQTLAKIDDAAAKANLGTAKANLLAAQAKLASAQAGTIQSDSQSPTQSGGTTATTATTTTTVAATPVVDPVAVAQAKAALDQAQLTVNDAQKALDATILKAPVAGKIAALNFVVGQKVGGGGTAASSASTASTSSASGSGSSKAFATLVDPTTMVAAVSWPESDAAKISVGQAATVTVASLGSPVTGTVTALDTTSTVVSNVVTYAGTVTLDQVPAGLKSGMTATVSVVTASKSGVIAIPSAAITTKGGTSTVNVSQNGQSTSRTVTIGLKGDGSTEITSGLSAGDQVVMSVGTVSATASPSSNGSTSSRTGTGLGGVTGGGTGGGGGGGGFSGGPPGP
jgi:macrolide-specific efflux system membrane fusion protein